MLASLALVSGDASAQNPAPPGMSIPTAAARRFPQLVRVGNLIGQTVLQPVENQDVLGNVKQVVRSRDGVVQIVVAYGGWFGIGARSIAVPVDAMALLGRDLEILDFTPEQLAKFPTFDGAGTVAVAIDDTIRVGLARPSH